VGNVAEWGPLATAGGPLPSFRKKFRNESVSGCGFLHNKTQNHRKITVQTLPKNVKKQQLTENQKSNEYRNISTMGAHFLPLSCQEGGSHPWTPVSHISGAFKGKQAMHLPWALSFGGPLEVLRA